MEAVVDHALVEEKMDSFQSWSKSLIESHMRQRLTHVTLILILIILTDYIGRQTGYR